jgi:hypothetical protein
MLDYFLELMDGVVSTHLYTNELPKRTGDRGYGAITKADL